MERPRLVPAPASDRIPILGTVAPGREHYCPILARHLDAMWRGHAPLYYALHAGRTAPYERAIPTGAASWTGSLLAGVEHLRRELGCSRVFVLLEDHVPLWPCDAELLAEIFEIAEREDLSCVFFNKYEWPWSSAENHEGSERGVAGPPETQVVTIDGHRLAHMPREHRFYNQCQPALWRVEDYVALLAEAVRSGVEDPWTFESFSLPDQAPHCVSEYQWPSRHCGYRRRGRVYLRALYVMAMPEGRALREELLRERFPMLPRRARWALGGLFGLWGRVRGLPRRARRSPSPRRARGG